METFVESERRIKGQFISLVFMENLIININGGKR